MSTRIVVVILCCVFAFSFGTLSCGTPEVCTSGATETCQCDNGQSGVRTCKNDSSGYDSCSCQTQEVPADSHPKETPETTDASPDNPTSDDTPGDSSSEAPAEIAPEKTTTEPVPESCNNGFLWQGACYSNEDFCESKKENPGWPIFSATHQKFMAKPYIVVNDQDGNPAFCKPKQGFFFHPNSTNYYAPCDGDNDGWIRLSAYRAYTHSLQHIRENANCTLREIKKVVYYRDRGPWFRTVDPQTKKETWSYDAKKGDAPQTWVPKKTQDAKPLLMVETDRNDGEVSNKTEMPIYSQWQKPLQAPNPNGCTSDNECNTGNNEVCYRGNCIEGRRFESRDINSLTKGCIQGLDLNDNKISDAAEGPKDTPPGTDADVFQPLLPLSYFMELHVGFVVAEKDAQGDPRKKEVTWVIVERRRRYNSGSVMSLGLKCREESKNNDSKYWRVCYLKDDQQCEIPDPNDPTKTIKKPGLSQCWLPKVEQALPSLFKCVVFDNKANPIEQTRTGIFHRSHHIKHNIDPTTTPGYGKYSRTRCKFTKVLSGSKDVKRDLEFSCEVDRANPPPTKNEVGWACVQVQDYKSKGDYLAGCISEKVEQVYGPPGGKDDLFYYSPGKEPSNWHVYGYTWASKKCGPLPKSGEKGNYCSRARIPLVWGGNNGETCGSCKVKYDSYSSTPAFCSPLKEAQAKEVCGDGLDNNCDGQIDEGKVCPCVVGSQRACYTLSSKECGHHSWGSCTKNDDCKKGADEFINKNSYTNMLYQCRSDKKCYVHACRGQCAPSTQTCQKQSDGSTDWTACVQKDKPAKEFCDGKDNDCDGQIDEGLQQKWYLDADKDGYGSTTPYQFANKGNTACRVNPGIVKPNLTKDNIHLLCTPDGKCESYCLAKSLYWIKGGTQGLNCQDKHPTLKILVNQTSGRNGDCYDDPSNITVAAQVYPGQTKYFDKPYGPNKSWDYNCNNKVDYENNAAPCTCSNKAKYNYYQETWGGSKNGDCTSNDPINTFAGGGGSNWKNVSSTPNYAKGVKHDLPSTTTDCSFISLPPGYMKKQSVNAYHNWECSTAVLNGEYHPHLKFDPKEVILWGAGQNYRKGCSYFPDKSQAPTNSQPKCGDTVSIAGTIQAPTLHNFFQWTKNPPNQKPGPYRVTRRTHTCKPSALHTTRRVCLSVWAQSKLYMDTWVTYKDKQNIKLRCR